MAGVKFDFEMIYRFYNFDKEQEESFFEKVLEILKVLEHDTLGGAGSRGCGKAQFKVKRPDGKYVLLDELNVKEDFPLKALGER